MLLRLWRGHFLCQERSEFNHLNVLIVPHLSSHQGLLRPAPACWCRLFCQGVHRTGRFGWSGHPHLVAPAVNPCIVPPPTPHVSPVGHGRSVHHDHLQQQGSTNLLSLLSEITETPTSHGNFSWEFRYKKPKKCNYLSQKVFLQQKPVTERSFCDIRFFFLHQTEKIYTLSWNIQ